MRNGAGAGYKSWKGWSKNGRMGFGEARFLYAPDGMEEGTA